MSTIKKKPPKKMNVHEELRQKCRLCFVALGMNDVTKAPSLQKAIAQLYGVNILPTDRFTKLICEDCTEKTLNFTCHLKRIETGQILYTEMFSMVDEMSHMKFDKGSNAGAASEVMNVLQVVPKNEDDDEDEDMYDQMTATPPDLYEEEVTTTQPEEPVASTSQITVQETDHDQRESRNKSDQKDANKKQEKRKNQRDSKDSRQQKHERQSTQNENEKIATHQLIDEPSAIGGRIQKRRQTMISLERPNTPTVITAKRKRRLSADERDRISSETGGDKNRNKSQTDNHTEPNKAKKMKLSDNSKDKQPSTSSSLVAKSSRVSKSIQAKPEMSTQSTSSSVPSSSQSPITLKISMQKHRDKKFKSKATPPITQYFIQQPQVFKCDTCVVILKSQNEVNFHNRIHKKGRCMKCKKTITDDSIDNMHKHMISCLFLSNRLSNKCLTRFFKLKVGVDRLTPDEINNIQKTLSLVKTNKPAPKSKQRDKNEKEAKTKESEEKRSDETSTDNTKDAGEKSAETNTKTSSKKSSSSDAKSTNEHDDKSSGKKSKNKKTPKIKSPVETNDEFVIEGTGSAALNWIDDNIKDKPFTLRNFDTVKPTYIEINDQPTENEQHEKRIASIVETLKQKKDELTNSNSKALPLNLSLSAERGDTSNRSSPNVSANVATQLSHPAPSTSSTAISSPKPPINIRPRITAGMPSSVGMPSLNSMTPPNIPTASNAAPLSIATTQPNTALNTPNSTPAYTGPQLLSIPPLRSMPRSRALSVHMSQGEYSGTDNLAAMRRQSVCDRQGVQSPSTQTYLVFHQPPPPFMTQIHTNLGDFRQSPTRRTPVNKPSVVNTPPIGNTPPLLNTPPVVNPPPFGNAQSFATRRPLETKKSSPAKGPIETAPNETGSTPTIRPLQIDATPSTEAIAPTVTPTETRRGPSTLKILTPDDLNSRAMHVSQSIPPNSPNTRIDSPNSMENNTNINNSNINNTKRVSLTKRPRTKTTPLRSQAQIQPAAAATNPPISDDADISISVSLSRLGHDQSELILTLNNIRLNFDTLTIKRQNEVQSSLLKDDVWKKMLEFLKTMKPTQETLNLFQKILPKPTYNIFLTELKHVYGNYFG